jgi:ubiquitin carboxyl-terminal hydrolase 34
VGNMSEMLHRKFCYDFVPKLWEGVRANLLGTPDSNLRNFTSQKISESLTGMGMLLKRVYSLKEKTEMIDKLEMQVALKCFNSDFLERKLQGLKAI